MSKKRSEALAYIAFDLGMNFQIKDEWGLLGLLKDFHLFKQGSRKRIESVIQHKDGMLESELHIFDYQYTISTGKTSATYKQTVFFMQSKKLGLPQFLMRPEHFFNKVSEWLHLSKDIDFVEYPQFSDQYWLQSKDEDYLRATMHEFILHFFTIEKNWSLEGCNYYLIFYRNNYLFPPEKIKDFYKKGMEICNMLYQDEYWDPRS
ncbi:MAG: hypothetical protein SFU99_16300 [Saprospiraceae bacterium]|nr:hypothetical protein [Saprospiraceae bacterium]